MATSKPLNNYYTSFLNSTTPSPFFLFSPACIFVCGTPCVMSPMLFPLHPLPHLRNSLRSMRDLHAYGAGRGREVEAIQKVWDEKRRNSTAGHSSYNRRECQQKAPITWEAWLRDGERVRQYLTVPEIGISFKDKHHGVCSRIFLCDMLEALQSLPT